MENLIKVQALIQQIEQLTLVDPKYRSKFEYRDETTLKIETYCDSWNIAIYQIFSNTPHIVMYIEGNTTLKVIDLKHREM